MGLNSKAPRRQTATTAALSRKRSSPRLAAVLARRSLFGTERVTHTRIPARGCTRTRTPVRCPYTHGGGQEQTIESRREADERVYGVGSACLGSSKYSHM